MLTKRIIPCLDVRNGRVTKGVKFKNNIDLGDPVEMAVAYSEGGADELVFYDITASAERRPTDIGMVAAVAESIRIPFAVGGGVSDVGDMERVILAGAEKVSVNSLAVRNPQIIADGARAGFELTITKLIAEAVPVPVVASGGAGQPSHLADAFNLAHADAAIVAGMIHTGDWTIAQIKEELAAAGIPVRKVW